MTAGTVERTWRALADPTRREILERVAGGPRRVTDLAEPFDMSLNAVSKHVRVLEEAGLVRRDVRGREHRISLEARPLMELHAWLDRYRAFWERSLDGLEEHLAARRDPPPEEEDDDDGR